jgi:hypothetical protein
MNSIPSSQTNYIFPFSYKRSARELRSRVSVPCRVQLALDLCLGLPKFNAHVRARVHVGEGVLALIRLSDTHVREPRESWSSQFRVDVHRCTPWRPMSASGQDGMVVCAHCSAMGQPGPMKRCGRCCAVYYCSPACQKADWTKGHKAACKPIKETGKVPKVGGPRGGASSGGDRGNDGDEEEEDGVTTTEPVNPCPICLVNEDAAGSGTASVCCSCGQLFCGDCAQSVVELENCPVCRAPHRVVDAERSERLHRILDRSTGRHTAIAEFFIGTMHEGGIGVPINHQEAVRWYRLAAGRGFAMAEDRLGACFDTGVGVPQDYAEAIRLYRRAAAQNDRLALYTWGGVTSKGLGSKRTTRRQ